MLSWSPFSKCDTFKHTFKCNKLTCWGYDEKMLKETCGSKIVTHAGKVSHQGFCTTHLQGSSVTWITMWTVSPGVVQYGRLDLKILWASSSVNQPLMQIHLQTFSTIEESADTHQPSYHCHFQKCWCCIAQHISQKAFCTQRWWKTFMANHVSQLLCHKVTSAYTLHLREDWMGNIPNTYSKLFQRNFSFSSVIVAGIWECLSRP